MFKIGCSEQILEVPLFAELYGYGPYAARRNTGVHEPLYCRAFSFSDGKKRAMIVYSDVCSTDDLYARELRAVIASRFRMDPEGIAVVATHTHSGPALNSDSPDTSGIRNAEFQNIWKRTAIRVAEQAFRNEEEIVSAEAGKAFLDRPIGTNRVDSKSNITDPAIRWMRFIRPDGSVKLLIHNHGVHGIADNGPLYKKVSSDWMGAANRIIRERQLADYALFLQGPAGDINTRTCCRVENRDTVGSELASEYVDHLAAGLKDGSKVDFGELSFRLKTFEFPTVKQTPEELLEDAAAFRARGKTVQEKDYWAINASRLEEMAQLAEQGYELGISHDLQIIRIGETEFYFVPGELYIEPGIELLDGSASKYPFAATLANGNGGYLFTEKSALRYPSPSTTAEKMFGFYEIYGYMHQLRFKYQNRIAPFIISSFRAMENE